MAKDTVGQGRDRRSVPSLRMSPVQAALAVAIAALGGVVALALVLRIHLFDPGAPPMTNAPGLSSGSAQAFAFLSVQHSNYCSLSADKVVGFDADAHLQGACCSAMDMAKYEWQVTGLRRYSSIPEVPPDPYDVTVALAKELLRYDAELSLTADQQSVYDAAMAMTDDKAPCCCQCWRWYMTRGLTKFLIVRHGMAAQDLASIVDLVNGCGGPMDEGGSAAAGTLAKYT